jgi:TrkA domain protein
MTQIERTTLPGIGISYTVHAGDGQRLGVICHRQGDRELIVYHRGDPERAHQSLILTRAEAQHVAQLLHSTTTIEHLGASNGITVAGLRVAAGSLYDGHHLGDVTGQVVVSVIAVLRHQHTYPLPGPDFLLQHDDVVVASGTGPEVQRLGRLLSALT